MLSIRGMGVLGVVLVFAPACAAAPLAGESEVEDTEAADTDGAGGENTESSVDTEDSAIPDTDSDTAWDTDIAGDTDVEDTDIPWDTDFPWDTDQEDTDLTWETDPPEDTDLPVDTDVPWDTDAVVDSGDTDDTDPPGVTGPLLAFPGAEGFGAQTTGGRGGSVCRVTNGNASGSGSLQACVDAPGARVIVFRYSGVIQGPIEIHHGDLTIAGQTSPDGVVVNGGLICDNVYDPNTCNNVILRHLRFRRGNPDSVRIGGASDIILDHVSMANADDENLEISRSSNVTIQNSIIAEPIGAHYQWGGVLMNYSTHAMPLDNISLHHNLWNGVFGRLPEITCEENNDAPGSNCSGHTLHLELTSNLMWDVSDPIWYNRCTGTNDGNYCPVSSDNFFVDLNWRENWMVRRSSIDADMIENAIDDPAQNDVYYANNRLQQGSNTSTYALGTSSIGSPHAYPPISVTPVATLTTYMQNQVGAFPRDTMDDRLLGYLSLPIDSKPAAWSGGNGVNFGDALALGNGSHPAPPTDTDADGMPDSWETLHGLNPASAGAAATGLSANANNGIDGCWPGYTDLECYINELADSLQP